MVDITVEQLAKQIGYGISPDILINQLKKVDININNPSDIIKEEQKIKLLHMLKKEQFDLYEKYKQISFKRTITSSIKLKVPSVKGMFIDVTYKKSRTYIKQNKNNNQLDINNKIEKNEINNLNTSQHNIIENKKIIDQKKNNEDIENNEKKIYDEKHIDKKITISNTITILDLSKKLMIKPTDIINFMMNIGHTFTINQIIDQDTECFIVNKMKDIANQNKNINSVKNNYILKTRSPVITIMGHVDHGKTTLIDYIRKSSLIKNEHGGITQHIGAYNVNTIYGNMTFLDTPGHEAFKKMRAHGSKCTDIIVIVIAADDGVMPQTKEAINHAKEANVPIIIAINKIDKDTVDIEKIINELSHFDLIPETWGGDTIFVNISAKTGKGIDILLETINLQSELLELKSYDEGSASGIVLESRINQWKGPITSLIIQNGKLSKGDIILSGLEYGKIKEIIDEKGNNIKYAIPSMAVDIVGLSKILIAGDSFVTIKDEKTAKNITNIKKNEQKEINLPKNKTINIEDFVKNKIEKDNKVLNIILKTDVYGSIDAILYLINNLDNINIKIINANIGSINETDIHLAMISESLIIGFNVKCTTNAKKMAENENIQILYHNIIYNIIEDLKNILEKKIEPILLEKKIGVMVVKEIFKSQKSGQVLGCVVTSGVIKKSSQITIIRNEKIIYKSELESLRRFKEDVNEVKVGNSCGVGIKNYNDIKINDIIEIYEKVLNKNDK